MNLLETAYLELFSEPSVRECVIDYSGRFKGYNANIRMTRFAITINASKNWKGISPEIQKGLFQELLVRIFKAKKQTISMDLYHNFIKSMSFVAPRRQSHPVLEESFERVNASFFANMMERPNLRIGKGINRLGTYEYATDTLSISSILLENPELMDYVMYHEMLHKKHQYTAKRGRHRSHSAEFREDERKFPNAESLERELQRLVRRNKGWLPW